MTGQPAAHVRASLPLQTSLVLGALPSAVACARLHARNVMYEWNLPSIADSIELVVSELVTNAVRASTDLDGRPKYDAKTGLARVGLRLSSDRTHVRIEVWDQDSRPPIAKTAGPDDESGRGLMLVEALCERLNCAATPRGDGKVVWAEISMGLNTRAKAPY
jgi:anti-sigma regulatory factor (Ser/Thr protein kinase)